MENFIKENESELRKYIELTDKLNQLLEELKERKIGIKYYFRDKKNKMDEIIEGVSRETFEINTMKNAIEDYTITSEKSDILTQHNSEIKKIIEDGITTSEKKIDVMIENYKEIYNSDERIKITSLRKSEEKNKLIDIISKKQTKLYALISKNIQIREKELEKLKEDTKREVEKITNERKEKDIEIKNDIDKKEKIVEELSQQKYDNIKDETTRNRLLEVTEKTINRLKNEIAEKKQDLDKLKSHYSNTIYRLKDNSLADFNKLDTEIKNLNKLIEELSNEIADLTESEKIKQINTDKLKEILSKTIDLEKEPEQNTSGSEYFDEAMENCNKSQPRFYYVEHTVGNIKGKEITGYYKCIRNMQTGELEIVEPNQKNGEFLKSEYVKTDNGSSLEYIKYRINEKKGKIEKVKTKSKLGLLEKIKNKLNKIFTKYIEEENEENSVKKIMDEETLRSKYSTNVSGKVQISSNEEKQDKVDRDISDDE